MNEGLAFMSAIFGHHSNANAIVKTNELHQLRIHELNIDTDMTTTSIHESSKNIMNRSRSSSSLFQVYLRLKPPIASPVASSATSKSLYPELPAPERYLTVEEPHLDDGLDSPTHITVTPPTDSKRRAVEKFAFTQIFEEASSQLDVFGGTGVVPLIEGVLGDDGRSGRDGLLATLGVTGSGKVQKTVLSMSKFSKG